MSFKENLLKKIRIKNLAASVLKSIAPSGSGVAIDRESMKELLETGGFPHLKIRDIDFYILENQGDIKTMLALDNELAIYKTTPEDAAMRKSPLINEMVNIRKIIKILSDKDVVVSKREASLTTVADQCIDALYLGFNPSDIDALAQEGRRAFKIEDTDGVAESVAIFSELLGYDPLPKPFKRIHKTVMGAVGRTQSGEMVCGPILIYDERENRLKLVDERIGAWDKERLQWFMSVDAGLEEATLNGVELFQYFKENVVIKGD